MTLSEQVQADINLRKAIEAQEIITCSQDPIYFVNKYCKILDGATRSWINFELWEEQEETLAKIHENQLIIILKARQLGLTWLVLAYGLWQMLFEPIATVMIFSRRENEAVYLLGIERLRGMYKRLPKYFRPKANLYSGRIKWQIHNESVARAFPTGLGDSYTATLAIVDEADLAPNLDIMLTSIKPTIDAGGKLILVSRSDKGNHNSTFKRIFKAAEAKQNNYAPVFLSWDVHPNRDKNWYDRQIADSLSLDDVYEQYPSTPQEALSRGTRGVIYPNFGGGNVHKKAVYDPNEPFYWGVDDGYIDPRVILFFQHRYFEGMPDRIVCFREYVVTQEISSQSIINALVEFWKEYGYPVHYNADGDIDTEKCLHGPMGNPVPDAVYYDPSAKEFSARCFDEFNLFTVAGYNKVNDGIKVVRRLICDHNGQRLIVINPNCQNLIESMRHYSYSETQARDGGDPRPSHDEYSHPADALRYYIATEHYAE